MPAFYEELANATKEPLEDLELCIGEDLGSTCHKIMLNFCGYAKMSTCI